MLVPSSSPVDHPRSLGLTLWGEGISLPLHMTNKYRVL